MNLSETNISNEISFVLHNDENIASSSSHNRAKQKLLEHIYSGTDVILITSSQQKTGPLFLQQCFADSSDQIRTIFLNSASFPQAGEANNPSHDLSMISAVVYESIHLDTHFAIIMDDADKLPLQILNELIKLALAINSSKNNVNFIFAGGPGLLGVVQQISEITRLGLAHCSLDEIKEEDIEAYIDGKQSECIESKKLKFNKYALKRISSHANGNLYKASTLLEWCRKYASHTGNFKVTAGSIDEILTNSECNHLLSGYPAADFSFAASTQSSIKDENIEFSKQDIVQTNSASLDEASKTVYIDEANSTPSNKDIVQKNIYEKVMATTTSDVVSINGSEVMSVSLCDSNQPSEPVIVIKPDSSADQEYQDTYHIEALKDINNPLSPTYADEEMLPVAPAQLTKSPSNASNSAFLWTFFVLSILIGSFYLFTSNIISYNDVRNYIGTIFSSNTSAEPIEPVDSSSISVATPALPRVDAEDENRRKITALVELAESQINQKKLSTPPSDNAMETYRLILDLNPNNEQALAGVKLIKERYQTWAKLDIKDGNSKRAIYFLQRAIEISPDEEALNLLADLQ